jgi:hypothetical protein
MAYADFYDVAPWHDTTTDKDQSAGFMICKSMEIKPISLYTCIGLITECSRQSIQPRPLTETSVTSSPYYPKKYLAS